MLLGRSHYVWEKMRSDIPIENLTTKYGAGFHWSFAFDDATLPASICCDCVAVSLPIGAPPTPIMHSFNDSIYFNHYCNFTFLRFAKASIVFVYSKDLLFKHRWNCHYPYVSSRDGNITAALLIFQVPHSFVNLVPSYGGNCQLYSTKFRLYFQLDYCSHSNADWSWFNWLNFDWQRHNRNWHIKATLIC